MSIKTAIQDGAQSANLTRFIFGRIRVPLRSFSDNPYDRKSRKKEHVAWHNAFYETRKNNN